MSMSRLFIRPRSPGQGSPSLDELAAESLGRGPSPLVRGPRIPQTGPWGRPPTGTHHRPECRNDPPWPAGTRTLPGRIPGGAHPPPWCRTAALEKKDPSLPDELKGLLEDHTGGNPMQVRKFVRRSLRNLAKDLQGRGHPASHTTVSKLQREQGYSPKANRKRYASTRTGISSSVTSPGRNGRSWPRVCPSSVSTRKRRN